MYKVVGIGDCVISNETGVTLKTFALASCIGLTAYSPSKKVLGMVHIALPDSSLITHQNNFKPGYYADTAVPMLFNSLCKDYNCQLHELVVRLYGGANSINDKDIFVIGRRNITAVTDILKTSNIPFCAEQTSGTISRTVAVEVSTGKAKVDVQPITI